MNFKQLIPEYPLGSDITIINAMYHYGKRDQDTGEYNPDTMTIIYKDNTTGEKNFTVIDYPEYEFYMLKNNIPTPKYREYFEKEDNLYPIKCRYKNINFAIASALDNYNQNRESTDLYKRNIRNRDFAANKEFQKDFRVFGSDIPINDFYRMRFDEQYKNTESKVSRVFLDIEADGKLIPANVKDRFPRNGNCPINAISYMDREAMVLDSFLLNQEDVNPQVREFINSYNEKEFNKEFKEFLVNTLGGEKRVESFNLQNLRIRVHIFDDELAMLKTLFKYINFTKPDFLMCWNMAFDIPFIIDRIRVLGGNPEDIICPKEFPDRIKFCEYVKDDLHDEWNKRDDYANITSYTVYLDQLIQFASRRGNGSKFQSYSLDNIGEEVAGVNKLDYHHITNNLAELPYKAYRTFVKYNMMDVLVQYCIEYKADDILYVFDQALLNATEYKKIHRQTVYLTNRATVLFKQFGNFILGNNYNKYKPKPMTKYEGAYVADPTKFSDKNKDKINGRPIMRARNAIDFDFTRLYPSITQEYNMAPNTAIGYIQIPKKVYEHENAINNDKYTRSGQFIEDMTSDAEIEFPHRWFHLANFKEAYYDLIEYFNMVEQPYYPLQNGDILPKSEYHKDPRDLKIAPIVFVDSNTDELIHKKIDSLSRESKMKLNMLLNDKIEDE